jgi:hypothetical protein
MLRKITFWLLAFLITASTAVYQRLTGPTYPIDGSAEIGRYAVEYTLPRGYSGDGDAEVVLLTDNPLAQAVLHYKRYKSPEIFEKVDFTHSEDGLTAGLPHQPPAGKLEYYVELIDGDNSEIVPGPETVVIRFTGGVPSLFLGLHIFFIFFGMLFANRTGLEAITIRAKTRNLTLWTTILLFIGGMIFGPVVQKYAFGALWTGVPFGWDLTDNKTLIFVLIWIITLWRHRINKSPRYFVLAAFVITLIMYLIPHSIMGSELDYTTGEVKTG